MPRPRILAIALFSVGLVCLLFPALAGAQFQPPSDYLHLTAQQAATWRQETANVVQLQGPVTIRTDRATMTADRAVVWLTPVPGSVLDQQRAEIALLGNAKVEQGQTERSGDVLFVETQVRGTVRLTADRRMAQDLSDSDLYRDATALRPLQNVVPPAEPGQPALPPQPAIDPETGFIAQRPWITFPPQAQPTTAPTTAPVRPSERVSLEAAEADTIRTDDGTIAAMLWGGATVIWASSNGDVLQLQADRILLFTQLTSLEDLGVAQRLEQVQKVVEAAYLEGDVRVTLTPGDRTKGEQRLRGQRVYYDLINDRAVLTDAVIHAADPRIPVPLVMRAGLVRQLARGEYSAEKVELSTSTFAVPSYSIRSDRAYVRTEDTQDPLLGQRLLFESSHNVFSFFHLPVFYWPWASGSVTERGSALREVRIGSSRGFGPSIQTGWGLFETIGRAPPEDLDVLYRLDYYGDRGPGLGLDAGYKGGFVTETSKQPWNFTGDFTSYFVDDHGEDRLGRERTLVEPEDNHRYRVLWTHQHFFPNDWQLQLRGSLVSDPTFLEEWFEDEFDNGLPHDESIYLKRQRGTEAITLGANFQPNDFVTTADLLQENFEIERYPEVGYYRIGDSFASDQFTFYSANTASALHFKQSDADYTPDLGFRPGQDAGLPSLGTTGVTDDTVFRGDFREEVAYPFDAGRLRVMPYVFGRLTAYSDSPDGSGVHRVFAGTGVRMNTAFWKVDNSARSDLFDINRIRHVIEPELNLFTSVQTDDREDVFIYDENVDAINDVSAMQIGVTQRWQTKRGGPGRWRSVDFFTLHAEANLFLNQPDDDILNPVMFRGLFFPSSPETSIPRNSINADALWRVSDATAILADVQYNLDETALATTSIGMAAQRDARLSYFAGIRYIGEINSTIASVAVNYELTPKYTIRFSEAFSFSERENENTSITVIRKFDRFFMTFTFYNDAVNDESGFRFGLYPEGLGFGLTSDQFQNAFGPER